MAGSIPSHPVRVLSDMPLCSFPLGEYLILIIKRGNRCKKGLECAKVGCFGARIALSARPSPSSVSSGHGCPTTGLRIHPDEP